MLTSVAKHDSWFQKMLHQEAFEASERAKRFAYRTHSMVLFEDKGNVTKNCETMCFVCVNHETMKHWSSELTNALKEEGP